MICLSMIMPKWKAVINMTSTCYAIDTMD